MSYLFLQALVRWGNTIGTSSLKEFPAQQKGQRLKQLRGQKETGHSDSRTSGRTVLSSVGIPQGSDVAARWVQATT
jgi:hypothetical protein